MKKFLITFICLFFYNIIEIKSSEIIKMSCEYEHDLIKKRQKNIGFLKDIDRSQICKIFSCSDVIEIHRTNFQSNGKEEYRLRNSWFNHQGILLDNFLKTDKVLKVTTFVSQAYFLESYTINRITGKTKRIFYKFDDPEFFDEISKLEKNKTKKRQLYNSRGKLSLETLKYYSIEPREIFYFEGSCFEGVGV